MHYAPPNAELLVKLMRFLSALGYRITVTLYEDESIRLVGKGLGQAIRIGLGVPW
jgi:hypothetical protein